MLTMQAPGDVGNPGRVTEASYLGDGVMPEDPTMMYLPCRVTETVLIGPDVGFTASGLARALHRR